MYKVGGRGILWGESKFIWELRVEYLENYMLCF